MSTQPHVGPGPDLKGTTFINPNCANPVLWKALYYTRNGNWVCQEAHYDTTCQYHFTDIQIWAAAPTRNIETI